METPSGFHKIHEILIILIHHRKDIDNIQETFGEPRPDHNLSRSFMRPLGNCGHSAGNCFTTPCAQTTMGIKYRTTHNKIGLLVVNL
jgi:hypothetical protein